ncbi:MAG TPA: gas vesicle protein [Propionibacteriaceae bacterium]|nr:gas vesicle protein [Propionibacteriaceae bacterium]
MAEKLTVRRVGEHALAEVADLVGCPAEGVTGIRGTDDGWIATIEVLEVGRVPETTDVLASYEVTVDRDGDVTEFHRVRRYLRGQVDD